MKNAIRRVIVESPYAGDIELNLKYLRACLRDCLLRGEAPFASHAIYTQPGVLRDEISEERMHGITAGFAWREVADATIVYNDLGVSRGMEYGISHATELGHTVEYRSLGEEWQQLESQPTKKKTTRCQFDIAWVGLCNGRTVEDSLYCEWHFQTECCMCSKQATHSCEEILHSCEETSQFICNEYLCDECIHHLDYIR